VCDLFPICSRVVRGSIDADDAGDRLGEQRAVGLEIVSGTSLEWLRGSSREPIEYDFD
jgi:hypothetical protein